MLTLWPDRFPLLKALIKDDRGAVAIMFVLFMNVMVSMLCLSLDLGRGYLASSQMQNAATAASISAAIEDGDATAAKRYFVSNLPVGQMGVRYDYDKDVKVDVGSDSVSVIPANFAVPAFFPLGKESTKGNSGNLSIASVSTVGLPQGVIKPADYFFVLDSSGSMAAGDSISPSGAYTTRMGAVKEATQKVVSTIANAANAAKNYGISMIGWDGSILLSENLTNDFNVAQTWIGGLYPRGMTCGGCGLAEVQKYLPNSIAGRQKVVIFMTDGSMNVPTDGYGYAMSQCQAVKRFSPDVSVWAITFGTDVLHSNQNVTLRNQCASAADQSVHVNNGKELDQLFQQIFSKTGKVRVTR